MNIKQLREETKNLNILYAEDENLLRETTSTMFKNFFASVDSASNGVSALELYKEYFNKNEKYYDIVISDLMMPQLDGHDLSKIILELNPKQEIIIISAQADFRDVVNLVNIGVHKFLTKPISTEVLYQVFLDVARIIRKKKLEENDIEELNEYNEILMQREDNKVKALEEFSNALNISAIVSKTDTLGVITYVNRQFCDVCGYSEEDLIGQNNNILNAKTRSSSFYKKLWITITNKKPFKTLFENRHKDGSLYYVETTISPILNLEGEIVEFIAVSHDMTQLMKSMEETKKAQKSKEDFFINISHEMRTPLNSILSLSSLLKKRLQDDEKMFLMIETIESTGNELHALVESLLDVSKLKENSIELKIASFNPNLELTSCMDRYRKKAYEKNQEFISLVDDKLPKILVGDIKRVRQVIAIVLDNAVKFTSVNGKIEVSAYYDDKLKKLICQVKDNGIGISKENQEKIFNYEQLDSSLNRLHEGAGIGLSLAKELLKKMKGEISLKSIPQRGSLFKIEFALK